MAVEEALLGARGGRERDDGAAPGVRDDPFDAVLLGFFFFLSETFSFFAVEEKIKKNSPRAPASSPP